MKNILFAVIVLLLSVNLFAQTRSDDRAKGTLFIHGGAGTYANMWVPFIALAGGADAKILVIPFASQPPYTPEERGIYWVDFLAKRGVDADYVAFKREDADLPENLSKLDGVTGIWFSGGSQSLLRNHLLGTSFLERIKDFYKNGGTIGGTSAGATIMGRVLLGGSEGFGFIDFAVIHQHFSEWERQGELLNAVQNQNLAGIGIDEKTAVIYNPATKTFEVLGDASVTVYEPQSTGIKTQIFNAGNRFTINTDFTTSVSGGGYGMGLRSFNTNKNSVSRNEQFTVTFTLKNIGQDIFPGGRTSVALVDNNGNIVGQIMGIGSSQERNPGRQTSLITRHCSVPDFAAPGQYRLKIAIRTTDNEWRIVTESDNNTPTSIDFTVR